MSTVKITIPFHDKPLVLIDHDEKPFVALRPIVEGMGMSWKSQQRKLTTRFAPTVVIMTTVADDGKQRRMLCLPLKQLPAWLHTINPGKVAPAIRDTIRRYQAECEEVLWQYWATGEARREDIRDGLAFWEEQERQSRERGSEAGKNLNQRKLEKQHNRLMKARLQQELAFVWEALQ